MDKEYTFALAKLASLAHDSLEPPRTLVVEKRKPFPGAALFVVKGKRAITGHEKHKTHKKGLHGKTAAISAKRQPLFMATITAQAMLKF